MLEILKFTLPSLIILATVIVTMRYFMKQSLENDKLRYNFEYRKSNSDVIVPTKLRALERLTMLLERTTPESLLGRFNINGLNALQLHQLLLQAVRDEHEHNLSQQIYVSSDTWAAVKNAREFTAQLINQCALQCKHDDQAMHLAEILLATYSKLPATPIEIALSALHNEIRIL